MRHEMARTEEIMQGIAKALDDGLNGSFRPKKTAFVVLTATFGEIVDGRVNYVSNAERADMISILQELLARFEGRYDAPQPQGQPS